MRRGSFVAAVLAAALSLPIAGTQVAGGGDAVAEDAPATKAFTSEKGDFILQFPAAWTVEEVAPDPETNLKLRIRLEADGPAISAWGYVSSVPNARAQIWYQLPHHIKNYGANQHDVGFEPVPHLWTQTPYPEGDVRHLLAVTHRRRCCIRFVFELPAALWDRFAAGALQVVRSADTKLEDLPARPKGYRPLAKDGYLYLLPAAVKDKDTAAFHAYVLEAEKAYAKSHGPVSKPDANPIEILLHDTREAADALVAQRGLKPWSSHGVFDDFATGSLIASRQAIASAEARPDVAYSLVRVFHAQTFGPYLRWMMEMDAFGAWAEAAANRPLPAVPQSVEDSLRAMPVRFDALTRADHAALIEARGSLLRYLLLFRSGPQPYQDAWASFLKTLRTTGDFDAAEKILLALDQDKLVIDVGTFAAKTMKTTKGR